MVTGIHETRSMKPLRRPYLAAICAVVVGLFASGAGAETLRLGGSSSALGSMQVLAGAYHRIHPDVEFIFVPDLSSGGGVKALVAKALDIALTSRPLKEGEQTPDLAAFEYGRSPWVFATTVDTPASALTIAQLADIYASKVTTWPDGKPIRLVLYPESDPDNELLKRLSPGMNTAISHLQRDGMIVADTDRRMADAIERTPHSLGNSTLALLLSERRPLKPLALNGVPPSPSTIANGSYPYYKTFFLVVHRDSAGSARRFVNFVLSREGAAMLRANGHWVVEHVAKP